VIKVHSTTTAIVQALTIMKPQAVIVKCIPPTAFATALIILHAVAAAAATAVKRHLQHFLFKSSQAHHSK
jgi:hypothetical protein